MKIANSAEQLRCQYIALSSGHFFDKDTMRFFRSRLLSHYKRIDDFTAYFVTSEKRCFADFTRVFTVRKATLKDDQIDIQTVAYQLPTLYQAKQYLKNLV